MEINKELYEKLVNCSWLESCGNKKEGLYSFDVHLVQNKKEVMKNITSIKWENVCLEEDGDMTAFLCKNNKAEYNKYWNSEVDIIKEDYIPAISKRVNDVLNERELPIEILDDIKFNVLSILMADFYSEFYNATFFNKMLEIYLSGHLPCGWYGKYPEGKIIVF